MGYSRKVAESPLAYQEHLIESLARSERASKRKYLALKKSLEDETPQIGPTATINAVQILPTRDIGRRQSNSPESPLVSSSVKRRTLIGEILLCYTVLMDLLQYKHVIMVPGLQSSSIAMHCSARDSLERLKSDYGDVSDDIRTEAANNLQAR